MQLLYRDFDKGAVYNLQGSVPQGRDLKVSIAKVQCCRHCRRKEAAELPPVLQTLQRMGGFQTADFSYPALPWCQSRAGLCGQAVVSA